MYSSYSIMKLHEYRFFFLKLKLIMVTVKYDLCSYTRWIFDKNYMEGCRTKFHQIKIIKCAIEAVKFLGMVQKFVKNNSFIFIWKKNKKIISYTESINTRT